MILFRLDQTNETLHFWILIRLHAIHPVAQVLR